jgi:hypothetical protein
MPRVYTKWMQDVGHSDSNFAQARFEFMTIDRLRIQNRIFLHIMYIASWLITT